MSLEEENIFRLIETWEEQNLDLAMKMANANRKWLKAINSRYHKVLRLLPRGATLYDLTGQNLPINRKSRQPLKFEEKLVPIFNSLPFTSLLLEHASYWPWWVEEMSALEELDIDQGLWIASDKPTNLGKLKQLNSLTFTKVKVLPENIAAVASLEYLIIEKSGYIKLPEAIGNCAVLKELKVIDCNRVKIPRSLAQCSLLKVMEIKDTSVVYWPKNMDNLPEECELEIWHDYYYGDTRMEYYE